MFNYIEDDDRELNKLIGRLRGPLFRPVVPKKLYAVTVNIRPGKLINKRPWRMYKHDRQIEILTRMEACMRRRTPSIELVKITFEICPVLNQIHFHALYSLPEHYNAEILTYWNRLCEDPTALKEWRHIVIEEVYNTAGWIKYISKDIK